jgi:predicted nucleic acid-binding protein
MVKAVFDTNILIDLLNGVEQAGREMERYSDRAISIVTWVEVMSGGPETSRDMTRVFLDDFELVQLDQDVAERTVELRREGKLKLPDAIIRASAEARGGLLVTRNTKDFDADDPGVRVPYRL